MNFRFMFAVTIFVVLLAAASSARSTTITVTSTSNGSNDGTGCTLRDAIQAVNLRAPVGQCPAASGPVDTINLPFSPSAFTQADTHSQNAALPALQASRYLNLYGTGQYHSALTRDNAVTCFRNRTAAAGEFRLFEVNSGAAAYIQRVDFINGCADGPADPDIDYSSPSARGGAIINYGTLYVDSSLFFQNAAEGIGGAIYTGQDAILGVSASTFQENAAAGGGGALFVDTDSGDPYETDVTTSLFANNQAYTGTQSVAYGGAIRSRGTLVVTNSTFNYNSANVGGGIHSAGFVAVSFATFLNNDGKTHELYVAPLSYAAIKSSLFGSQPYPDFENCTVGNGALVTWYGKSISADSSCAGGNNMTGTPVGIESSLGYNGGPTQTLKLNANSVAIRVDADCTDAYGNPVATDQRGSPRPTAGCDAGAYDSDRIFYDGLQ